MEVKTFVIPYHRPDEIKIYPLGDMHLGIRHCAETKLKEKIREIKDDPLAYFIGMGDYGEFITPSDPRWDGGVIEDWLHPDNIAHDIEERVCEFLNPIKDKCIGLLSGNHEIKIRQHGHTDVHKNICEKLGVTPLGYSCFVRFIFKRRGGHSQVIKAVFNHGAGAAITKGAKITRFERFMNDFLSCRIVAMGHMHDIITDTKPYLDVNSEGKIEQLEKVGAVTGSWLRTYSQGIPASYGEQKGFSPTVLGCPVFKIKPDKNSIKVEG